MWGPQPLGWLWVASQVAFYSGSLMLGIVTAFMGLLLTLMLTLAVAARIDALWRILRRAAGFEQREGALARIFAVTAVVVGVAFVFWFVIIEGPGPTVAPRQ